MVEWLDKLTDDIICNLGDGYVRIRVPDTLEILELYNVMVWVGYRCSLSSPWPRRDDN